MKPRLLILTDPPVAPGYLPRLRYLCNYLHQAGYSLHVFTEQRGALNFAHEYPISTVSLYTGTMCDWLCKTIWSLLTNWHERSFAQWVSREIGKEEFDMIICTSFSTFPLGAAVQLASEKHLPLLVDIRDVDEQVDHSTYQYAHQQRWLRPFRGIYRSIQLRRRNRAISKAQVVTTISPWHVDFLQQFNPCVHLMYNGFDPAQFYFQAIPTDVFRITYIGSLHDFHDLGPLYRAVEILAKPDIRVEIHTPSKNPVVHTQLGDIIRQSSIMLVLTSKHTHGMMTTKFSEALGCEKPVLCIPSDEGCLASAIEQTHAGIATDDVVAIQSFILDKYQEWKLQGYTHQHVTNTALYNRLNIAKSFEDLLNHSTHL